jgi:predicted aspartyl protease
VTWSLSAFGTSRDKKEDPKGMTHVTVTTRHPAKPELTWEDLFLVDMGATDSLVPRKHLVALGLQPKGEGVYEVADGSTLKMDVTTADIEFMGGDLRWNDHLR